MSKGARLFVFAMFSILGASFFASTGVLMWEFRDQAWLDLASMDSHLFVFFPTMGIVALVAFFVPASVFVDLYWKKILWGRRRFLFGFALTALVSYLIANHILAGTTRSLWEIAPGTLRADVGDPAGCASQGPVCQRMPLLAALTSLRQVSRNHLGLAGFIRDCSASAADPLIQPFQQVEATRFCFASTPLSAGPVLQSDTECCKAQARLVSTVRDYYSRASERSLTAATHAALLPLKVFFLLVVLLISFLLTVHHKILESEYAQHMKRVEIGLLVGSISMLFFPLMSEAYIQSAGALFGIAAQGPFATMMPLVTFLFLVWALLTGLFFYRRANETLVSAARLGGVVVGNVGIIKYNLLIAAVAWALGAGASDLGLLALIAGCILAAAVSLATKRVHG
jgi:hypothetical protein